MLYLIRTFGRNKKSSLKIGWTNDMEKRKNQYYIHNPFFELLATRQGTEEDELKLHLYFTILGFKENFLCEWFKDNNRIFQDFHKSINKIEKYIWKYRNLVFRKEDIQNKLKMKIYWELKDKFFKKQLIEIDRIFILEKSKLNYKNLQKILE